MRPRDPAWTADGVVSERWAAISPVTGALDAFQWRVAVESRDEVDSERSLVELEELLALGRRPEAAIPTRAAEPAVTIDEARIIDVGTAGASAAGKAGATTADTSARNQTARSQSGPEPRSPAARSEASISVSIARPAAAEPAEVVIEMPQTGARPERKARRLRSSAAPAAARTTEAAVVRSPATASAVRERTANGAAGEADVKLRPAPRTTASEPERRPKPGTGRAAVVRSTAGAGRSRPR